MVKQSYREDKKPNKTMSASLGVLSLVVIIASISFGNHYPIPTAILALVYFAVALSLTINNRNIAKNKKEDIKKLTSEIVAYSLVTVFMIVLLFFYLWQSGSLQSNKNISQSPEEIASSLVQKAKFQTTLPQALDSITDLTDITAEGKMIVYHYQIHDADTSTITTAALRDNVQPELCANKNLVSVLKNGINFEYLYTIKETGATYTVDIQESDCL